MKSTFLVIASLAFISLGLSFSLHAAEKEPVIIKEIKMETVKFPKEAESGGGNKVLERDWFQIEVSFEVKAEDKLDNEITDEIEVKMYVEAFDSKKDDQFIVLTTTQTFVNVPDGEHFAYAYLPPGSAIRYGGKKGKDFKDNNVHVEILQNGRKAAEKDKKTDDDNWFSSAAQINSVLIPALDSPFYISLIKKLNQIKSKN